MIVAALSLWYKARALEAIKHTRAETRGGVPRPLTGVACGGDVEAQPEKEFP